MSSGDAAFLFTIVFLALVAILMFTLGHARGKAYGYRVGYDDGVRHTNEKFGWIMEQDTKKPVTRKDRRKTWAEPSPYLGRKK